MSQVFVSYAHSDGAAAAAAAKRALEDARLTVWMDDRIEAGDRFRGAITEALEQARCVLVLWSRAAAASPFVEGESGQAARQGTLLPCFLEEGIEDKVPIEQHGIQGLKLYLDGGTFTERQLERLVVEVRRKLSEQRVEPELVEVVRDLREKLQENLKDRYRLVNKLGHGSSSVIFRAQSVQNPGAEFAIKVTTLHMLLLTPGLYDSFVKICEDAARLKHPHIVNVHNVERKGELFLSVTRLVDGQPLNSTLKPGAPLPPSMVQPILIQVATALAYAHGEGVPHYALRPAKIIIDRNGNAHVTDFGTAHVRARKEALDGGDRLLGVPTYMSPEHCLGEQLTASSDQYSLGVIAYQMLTGAPPFTGRSPLEIMRHHCESAPRPLDQLGESHKKLAAIVLRMLAKSPGDRHLSLRLLVRELEHALPIGTSNLEIAYASYTRCLAKEAFIDVFYQRFIDVPGVREKFRHVDMGRQVEMLKQALKTVLKMGVDSESGQETIRRVSHRHGKADLTSLYATFVETLLATVREEDDECTPQVEEAWKQILNSFIEGLKTAQIHNPAESV